MNSTVKVTVLVFDGTPQRRDAHCQLFQALGCEVWKWEDADVVACHTAAADSKTTWDVILLHAPGSDENAFKRKSLSGKVLIYNGSGGSHPGCIPRAVSDPNPLKDFEAKGILEAVRDSSNQETFIERALAVWSAVPENLLSWALLETHGMGGLTADVELTNAAERELRQRSGDAATLNLPNAQKTIAEFRADL